MDRNDLVRSRNESAENLTKALKEKADLLQLGVDEKRSLSADEDTKLEKIQTDADQLRAGLTAIDAKIAAHDAERDSTIGALETDEQRNDMNGAERDFEPGTDEQRAAEYFNGDDYRSVFSRYLRASSQSEAEAIRQEVPDEFRAWGYSDANKGAPVVHRDFLKKLVEKLYNTTQLTGTMRQQTLGGLRKYVIETSVGSAVYRDPGEAYSENDGAIDNADIDIHNLGKIVKVDEELLDDSEINLPAYLATKFAQSFNDRMEEQAVTGSDAKGPGSILATVPVANEVNTAASLTISFDDLADLRAAVKSTGRAGAVWVFNPAVETLLMKLKDGDGRPLWTPSVREGEPGLIWGQGYRLSDYMEDGTTAADEAVLYGNVSKYITNYVRRSMSVRVLRELYAANGQVGYRGQLRHDFVNELPEAFSKLVITA
jgi:HK97 family phage major capsid protein